MSQQKQAQFRRELTKLYDLRTYEVRSLVFGKPKPGKAPKLTRSRRTESIRKLQDLATAELAKPLAKEKFDYYVSRRKSWHIKKGKGHGHEAKKTAFKAWFEGEFDAKASCIYIFWKGRKCIYVGKTASGKNRPVQHFVKFWFSHATRIDVYHVSTKTALPMLECLAIHRFSPVRNKQKAETKKWTSKCPLCEVHKGIQAEIRGIFSLN